MPTRCPNHSQLAPWTILATRRLLDREPWLSVREQDVRLPSGVVIEGYLLARSRDYAMVFAVLHDGTVPLVCQYKHGVGRASFDLPAGYLESPVESTLSAAQRELREETGLEAESWTPLGNLVVDTNRSNTQAHIFLALGAHHTAEPHLDATESLEVSYHRPEELISMVQRGEIDSMASVAGILLGLRLLADQHLQAPPQPDASPNPP